MEKKVTLKIVDNYVEAHLLVGKLESEGVYAEMIDHHMVGVDPIYSYAVGGIKIKVGNNQLELAKEILEEIERRPITDDNGKILICPFCESQNLSSGYTSAKSFRGILGTILGFIFTAHPLLIDTVYYCNDCKKDFIPADAEPINP